MAGNLPPMKPPGPRQPAKSKEDVEKMLADPNYGKPGWDIMNAESTPAAPAEPTKRLTFDIPKSLHARIKSACATEERFMNEEIIKLLEARWPKPE